MMHRATLKSNRRGWRIRACQVVLGVACGANVTATFAQQAVPPEKVARSAYESALERFANAQDDPQIAWQFGRACFDWAEFATNTTQRAALAHKGIDACTLALEKDPELAAAHYYLGMNEGQLARTMSLGALKLVQKMEAHFQKAQELEPEFDQAGPDRNLGLLYLEAPGWPVSLGNRSKACAHLRRAVTLAPHFPENRLNLMEAYARWNERSLVKREMKAWEENLEAARKQFSGNRWHWAWINWDSRLEALKQQLAEPVHRLRSPKDRG